MRRSGSASKHAPQGSPQVLGGEPFAIDAPAPTYHLRLYIAGKDKKSQQAIHTLKTISTLFAPGKFKAEIIDLRKHSELAKKDSVLAVPALLKVFPPPPTTFIGATKDHFTILRRLGIPFDPLVMTAYPRRRTQS
ncbi:MAG: hypothetical protein JO065_15690 [Acidobacteria bacterium]|nr:hypothetical protein [Acidobacteriota bacterium]